MIHSRRATNVIMKWARHAPFLLCSFSFAADRVPVTVPSAEEQQVQDLLDRLRLAVDNEDLRAYLSCFTKDMASKNKREVSVLFMTHDMAMEVDRFTMADTTEGSVEFMAKYTVYEDSSPSQIVSSVTAKRDGDRLVISKEKILSKTTAQRIIATQVERVAPFGPLAVNPCANGQCPVPRPRPKQNADPEVLEGISMFNDANGNPDPNGIMWVDPKQLLARFPDKLGVPPCMRAQLAKEARLK